MSFNNRLLVSGFLFICLVVFTAVPGQPVSAQEGEELVIEEIITIGSRSQRPRSAVTSTAPIDVLSAEDFNRIGNAADITDNLKALSPSYNATTASGDQDTFVRPVSMRGLAPDQTLVLVNGKRRHRAGIDCRVHSRRRQGCARPQYRYDTQHCTEER